MNWFNLEYSFTNNSITLLTNIFTKIRKTSWELPELKLDIHNSHSLQRSLSKPEHSLVISSDENYISSPQNLKTFVSDKGWLVYLKQKTGKLQPNSVLIVHKLRNPWSIQILHLFEKYCRWLAGQK